MDGSHSRRRVLATAGVAIGTAIAGCLGEGEEETTPDVDFGPVAAIDRDAAPSATQYPTEDGSVLRYRRYQASTDRVLVFLHGCGLDSRYLAPLGRHLADADVAEVITPDLRGHGPDPEQRGDVGHIGHLEEDLNDLVEVVGDIHSDPTVIVGGHGFGAGTAIRFADRAGADRIDGYLLVAPYLGRGAPTTSSGFGGVLSVDRDWMLVLDLLNGFGIRRQNHRIVVELDLPESVRDGNETDAYSYRMDASFEPEGSDFGLSSLGGSTAILAGREDAAIAVDGFEELFEAGEAMTTTIHDGDGSNLPEVAFEAIAGLSHYETVTDEQALEWIAEWLRSI